MKRIHMAYYKSGLDVEIAEQNLLDILAPKEMQPLPDLAGELLHKLENPLGTLPFSVLCQGKKRICVMICDLSRPMQTNKVLPVVLRQIEQSNPQAQINVLIALGTHRPLSPAEIDYLCGEEVAKKYNIHNHAFDNPDALQYIESSPEGFPLHVNKMLFESDLKVAIGAVKPHPIFGWSGGAKIIIPGVSGEITTGLSHWRSCPYKGVEIMGKTNNPVRAEVEKAVGDENLLDFIISAALTEASEIADIQCGHFIQAHRASVAYAEQFYVQEIKEPADAVVVGIGKWGADFWVGSMGLYQTEFFLKKGGTIVILAACPEGVSPVHPEVTEYGYLPYHKVKELIEQAGPLARDLTVASHLVHGGRVLEARQAECLMLSEGIDQEDIKKLGFTPIASVQEIMPALIKKHGKDLRILAIPGFNSTNIISSNPPD